MPVVAQHTENAVPQDPPPMTDDAHALTRSLTKSMETGTPWRSNFLRSSFSTQ